MTFILKITPTPLLQAAGKNRRGESLFTIKQDIAYTQFIDTAIVSRKKWDNSFQKNLFSNN